MANQIASASSFCNKVLSGPKICAEVNVQIKSSPTPIMLLSGKNWVTQTALGQEKWEMPEKHQSVNGTSNAILTDPRARSAFSKSRIAKTVIMGSVMEVKYMKSRRTARLRFMGY